MDRIDFDLSKLSKTEQAGFLAMNERQKAAFAKKWVSIETAKAEMNEKIVQANRRAKAKEAREKEAQRKADTHRKIENGALLEAVLRVHGADFLIEKDQGQKENEKLRAFLEYCFNTSYVKKRIVEMQ